MSRCRSPLDLSSFLPFPSLFLPTSPLLDSSISSGEVRSLTGPVSSPVLAVPTQGDSYLMSSAILTPIPLRFTITTLQYNPRGVYRMDKHPAPRIPERVPHHPSNHPTIHLLSPAPQELSTRPSRTNIVLSDFQKPELLVQVRMVMAMLLLLIIYWCAMLCWLRPFNHFSTSHNTALCHTWQDPAKGRNTNSYAAL